MLDLTGQAHNMIFSDRLEVVCSDMLLIFVQKCTGHADCCKNQPVSQPLILKETVTDWHFCLL